MDGVLLSGARSMVVNRGKITMRNRPDPSGTPPAYFDFKAFRISGADSKVINYGDIDLPESFSRAFHVQFGANNVEIEFLSGSLTARHPDGAYTVVDSDAAENVKLTFGGDAWIAHAGQSRFFRNFGVDDNVIILLPGATIQIADSSRRFAGLRSELSGGDNELKIGNFHESVGDRTGWVHAGQWNFGVDTDKIIIDTSPGVRFSNHGGVNHYRGIRSGENAISDIETMDIRSGNVVLGASVYMPNGKVYIHDAGRLTFEIGKRRDARNDLGRFSLVQPERRGEMIISRLVADELIFADDDPRVFIQFAHYLTASEIEKFRKDLATSELTKLDEKLRSRFPGERALSEILMVNKVLYDLGVDFLQRSSVLRVASSGPGGIRDVGIIALEDVAGLLKDHFRLTQREAALKIGQLRFPSVVTGRTPVSSGTGGGTPSTPSTPGGEGETGEGETGDDQDTDMTQDEGVGTGGSGGGAGGIMAIGLLALLTNLDLDLDETESELGQYYAFDRGSAKKRSRSSSYFSGLFRPDRGMWVRPAQSRFASFGASYFGAVSNRMSWDLQQSGDYFLRASLSPATSVSPTGWHSSASGETISLKGGWQGEGQRLQLGLTHGRYDANAKLYDSATQGNLFGDSKFHHTSVHASAVQTLLGGPMKMSASASLMAGQVEQAAYAAENAVMRAKVPAYRQSYAGTRLGFSAKSRKWFALSEAVSVKPHLKVSAMRTRSSVNNPVWLRQSDKVGALSFENATVLQGIPKSLNVVGIGTDVKPSSSRGVWRLGYAGMEVDGEYQHAAVAAYRMRF